MTDTGERFSAKAVCADGGQVLESADLGRREPLAENRQILFLRIGAARFSPHFLRAERVPLDRGTYSNSAAVVLDLQQFETAFLDRDPD